jgi:hypothetical protein
MSKFNSFQSLSHGSDGQQYHDWTSEANRNWFIQEKVDGSQFSFDTDGTSPRFHCRRQPCEQKQLFAKGIEMVKSATSLTRGYTYHTEYLPRPRSNVLHYERLPKYYVTGYDIQDEKGQFLGVKEMEAEFERCGMESVRCLFNNADVMGSDAEVLELLKSDVKILKGLSYLDEEDDVNKLVGSLNPVLLCNWLVQQFQEGKLKSKLGGLVEGCVLKCHNYSYEWKGKMTTANKKTKFVTKEFKEARMFKRKPSLYSPQEFIQWLGGHYNTEARFYKSLQRMKEHRNLFCRESLLLDGKETTIDAVKSELEKDLDADLIKEWKDEITRYINTEIESYGQKHWLTRGSNQMVENIFQWKQSNEPIAEKLIPLVCEAARKDFDQWFEDVGKGFIQNIWMSVY